MRDESSINPHFVIRDAGSPSGLQTSRLPFRGWKLVAVKDGAGDPPAFYVQVITGLTRLLRGTLFSFGEQGVNPGLRIQLLKNFLQPLDK